MQLADPDPEVRCRACTAILTAGMAHGIDRVLPMLTDADALVREHACGLLHDFGDERAIEPLVARMRQDADPQVRGTAAYALGGIGCPSAIPALIETMESDHEVDQLGHCPSSCAASALDDILGTNETRIRVSESLRKMRSGEPDFARLKSLALAVFQSWSKGRSV